MQTQRSIGRNGVSKRYLILVVPILMLVNTLKVADMAALRDYVAQRAVGVASEES